MPPAFVLSEPREPFRCQVRAGADGVVALEPAGELDIAALGKVTSALGDAQGRAPTVLVLDLRGLTFMDATGLHVIIDAESWAHRAGARLTVISAPGTAHRLLEVSGLDRRLKLADALLDGGAGDGRRDVRDAAAEPAGRTAQVPCYSAD